MNGTNGKWRSTLLKRTETFTVSPTVMPFAGESASTYVRVIVAVAPVPVRPSI